MSIPGISKPHKIRAEILSPLYHIPHSFEPLKQPAYWQERDSLHPPRPTAGGSRSIPDRHRDVRRLDALAPRQACPEWVEGSAIVRASLSTR
jgi:hypothetical protein